MPDTRSHDAAAGARFGKYELVEPIGKGGMAEVWKARVLGPAGFSRVLVVKRVLPHLAEDPQFAQMFLAEARLSARLEHPNIVQVFELGEVSGQYFLAMEHVRGRNLADVVRAFGRAGGAPPPSLGALVMRDVCRALAYAHAIVGDDGAPLQLVHRDVSPSNIMVTYDGAAKLLDFGIAKALGAAEEQTRTGALKGKFAYMAPEQLDPRARIDHRSDLFAAGVVLWEALTGARLFKGDSDVQTLALVRAGEVVPPSRRNPAVPAELDEVCLQALAREPAARFADGDAMAAALDACAERMGWRSESLKASMRELFPDDTAPRPPGARPVVAPAATATLGSRSATTMRWRRVEVIAGTAALLIASFVGWSLVHARAGRGGDDVPTIVPAETTPSGSPASLIASPPPASAPAASAPPPASAPPASAPPPAATVSVRVTSTPPGAELYLDGERAPRGRTPATLMLPRSTAPHRLTLKLRGRPPKVIPLDLDADSHVELALVDAAPPRAAVHKLHAAPHAHAVVRGDVVDPFK